MTTTVNWTMRWRLAAFGLALALAASLVGWAALAGLGRVAQLSDRLTRVQIQSFQTADLFRASLQELNTLLFRFQLHRDPNDWHRFLELWREHDRWIDAQQPTLTSAAESRSFSLINDAYDDYFKAANRLAEHPAAADAMEPVTRETSRLLSLDNQLLVAHQASLTRFLEDSQRSLAYLRGLVWLSMLALLGLGTWLATVVYREMIMPLRLRLVESTAIIAQQEKLASLGLLAAGVAHEIRNPLTAIKARLFTQQKHLDPGSRQATDAAFIDREINRLERIVKDFLQFARPAEPRLQALTVEPLLREVRELLTPQWEPRGVRIQLDEVCPGWIRVDPQQIQQVLVNLVQNAAESIGREGTVTLSARRATHRLGGQLVPVVLLEVSDTGHGIAPEIQKRLFDPFFTTKETGTGLGLSIAARIVEKHGGAMEFQTAPHRGTTFGIVLPLTPDP